jgi:signal transduction histidine kinase
MAAVRSRDRSGLTHGALAVLALLLFWTAVGLFFATAGGGVAHALVTWYPWGLLGWAMVAIDRRLPVSSERLSARLLWHLPLSVVFAVVYACMSLVADSALRGEWPSAAAWLKIGSSLRSGGMHWSLLIYWLMLGAYLAFEYHREVQERRRRAAHLENLLTEARLNALRAQLHPHFLFNALNTVSAYVESDPKRARAMLGHLGDLLRFSLDSEHQREVILSEEIQALDHYLAIQCARFGERLRIDIDVPTPLLQARVPALVLQPLVENAITHGLSPLPGVGEIRVAARERENYLSLTVRDNGVGLGPHWRLERDAGIGLSNTRSRLAETYGEQHYFSISQAPEGGVLAEIRIPCTLANAGDHGGRFAEVARAHRR